MTYYKDVFKTGQEQQKEQTKELLGAIGKPCSG